MAKKDEPTALATLNLKAAGCDAKDAVRTGKPVYMGRLIGVCETIKGKVARNGNEYNILFGDFAFTNAKGEQFTSDKLMLPGGVQEGIESKYSVAEGSAIEFAMDIWSNPDEKSSTGYKYGAKQLVETASSDRLQKLVEMVGKQKPVKAEAAS